MTGKISRRLLLGGLGAGMAQAAFAGAPLTSARPRARPVINRSGAASLVRATGLQGKVGFALVDAETGDVLDGGLSDTPMPPASVAKVPTALYALSTLGTDHRFMTRLATTGEIRDGRLEGDLVLEGSGDPELDTDALGALAGALKEAGVRGITGKFIFDDSALAQIDRIDGDQPEHVGYNPAISGLNLNFNRVHFEWKRNSGDYDVTMQARSLKFRPGVEIARMDLVDRASPVYTYEDRGTHDQWTVARKALGKEGARWLPVRHPGAYCAETFRTLARGNGIVLPAPVTGRRPGADTLLAHVSDPLSEVVTDMLDYSTNLTAETVGLAASAQLGDRPRSLLASGARMSGWLRRRHGLAAPKFVDHSGLGYGSEISARDMTRLLSAAGGIEPYLDTFKVDLPGHTVRAKTGTLNFVSGLAGYIRPETGRTLAFAIFAADVERRDAIPPEARERPPGARGWANRARRLQRDMIGLWGKTYA